MNIENNPSYEKIATNFRYNNISIDKNEFVSFGNLLNTFAGIEVVQSYTLSDVIVTDSILDYYLNPNGIYYFDLNKILPFEIRKTEGFILFIILTIALYLIILNFMGISISNMNITLNAQNIMTWIAGIIIATLIIRQGRSMNKKKK